MGISLQIPDGQIVALLGANGAGKTTVLRAVSGLLDVHNGEITKGEITLEESALLRRRYQQGLSGYTYLDQED